jgi:hypothetical protein
VDALPGFALICADDAGASVVLRAAGRAVVTDRAGHPQRLDALGLSTWSEQRLTDVAALTIGFTTDLVDAAAERPGADTMRSIGGTVLAGSVTVRVAPESEPVVPSTAEPGPEPAREPVESGPDPAAEPAEFEPEPTPEPPALPGAPVQAVACPYGHLGPPYEPYCRVCGTAIEDPRPFLADRPPLGLLRLSTGDVIPLDRGVIMGRNPRLPDELDPANEQSGHPQPARPHLIRLPSPDNDVSRTHVEVRLEDWHVLAVDLGSTNGTTVTIPGQPPVRLRAHEAMPLEPNAEVTLADEIVFRFEVPTP